MNRFFKCIFFTLLFGFFIPFQLSAAPEELLQADVRQDIMGNSPEIDKFMKSNSENLNDRMKKAMELGKISMEDHQGVITEMKKGLAEIILNSIEFRKTLKEPEHRLKLDINLLQLSLQTTDADAAMKILSNWKGEVHSIMVLMIAQNLQQINASFPKELDEYLTKMAKGSDEKFSAEAKKFLNPFLRNPEGASFPAFPVGKKTTDDKPLTLDRFKGKVLLVDFWATWCGPCRAEIPNLVKAYNLYKDKGFEIIGISYDKSKDDFDKYLNENKMEWPQYFDGKGWANEVGATYSIRSIPTMYLLDREGKVITTDLRNGKLEVELEKLLK